MSVLLQEVQRAGGGATECVRLCPGRGLRPQYGAGAARAYRGLGVLGGMCFLSRHPGLIEPSRSRSLAWRLSRKAKTSSPQGPSEATPQAWSLKGQKKRLKKKQKAKDCLVMQPGSLVRAQH